MEGEHIIELNVKLKTDHVNVYNHALTPSEINEKYKSCMNFDEFMADLDKPIPWYEDWFNAVVYRLPYRIKCAWDNIFVFIERGQNGYAKSDVWNLYNYLAEVISKSTEALANESHGYPPSCKDIEEWREILRTISSVFARVKELEKSGNNPNCEDQMKINEALGLLGKYWFYLWD